MLPITLYIFVHDDVPTSIADALGRAYFKNFTDEITAISRRQFVFKEIRSLPGMTDFNYKNENQEDALQHWRVAAINYKNTHNLSWGKTERYILVTKDYINEQTAGISYEGQPPMIASTVHYQVIAHEVGHSFNATHENAELSWNAWGGICETYMHPEISTIRGNCYRFTKKNREHIKAFLSDAP